MKWFLPPLHVCLHIILKRQSAFPLAPWLPSPSPSRTHACTAACTGNTLHAPFICSTLNTYCTHAINTHVMNTHAHKLEREKHQNSINPLRRSLKGFLKADFQVSTVCGGNGAEAFRLHAPHLSTLLLPISSSLSHTHNLPSSVSLAFLFSASLCPPQTSPTLS